MKTFLDARHFMDKLKELFKSVAEFVETNLEVAEIVEMQLNVRCNSPSLKLINRGHFFIPYHLKI